MAEWSNVAVSKSVVPQGTGGSNPSLSANKGVNQQVMRFTPRNIDTYKKINEPLNLLDGAQRVRFFSTSSPFPGYSGVLISPIHLQCQSYSRPCLKTLEDS